MGPVVLRALTGLALLSLPIQPALAKLSHRHLHLQQRGRNHTDSDGFEPVKKKKRLTNRAGQCAFPEIEGLVAVTPDSSNAGWAMSPDQECTAGSYCPFACPSGQLMNQWKPGTTYVFPESMDGGLFCDETGVITKPFPDEEYCVEGIGNVVAVNNCGQTVAFCQTVLPGNENMLIPTAVELLATLAVPGTSYWDATSAHYYVNPPGYTTEEACAWGTDAQPIGNWSPYVAGTNQDSTGNTYVKLGWNPIYTSSYSGVNPTFGLMVECTGDCVGLPCIIDPTVNGFGGVSSAETATGAGDAAFCIVTVTSGSASIVVFNVNGSSEIESTSLTTNEPITNTAEPVEQPSSTVTAILDSPFGSSADAGPSLTTKKQSPCTTMATQPLHTTTTHTTPKSSSSPSKATSQRMTSYITITSSQLPSKPISTSTGTSMSTSKSKSTSKSTSTSTASSSTISGAIYSHYNATINSTIHYTDLSPSSTISNSLAGTTSTGSMPSATSSLSSSADISCYSQGTIAGLVVAMVAACLY